MRRLPKASLIDEVSATALPKPSTISPNRRGGLVLHQEPGTTATACPCSPPFLNANEAFATTAPTALAIRRRTARCLRGAQHPQKPFEPRLDRSESKNTGIERFFRRPSSAGFHHISGLPRNDRNGKPFCTDITYRTFSFN